MEDVKSGGAKPRHDPLAMDLIFGISIALLQFAVLLVHCTRVQTSMLLPHVEVALKHRTLTEIECLHPHILNHIILWNREDHPILVKSQGPVSLTLLGIVQDMVDIIDGKHRFATHSGPRFSWPCPK